MAATSITVLTADQFAQRIVQMFPPGWSSQDSRTATGVLYQVAKMLGSQLSFEEGALQYALQATRIQTAVGNALDLASLDFFGPNPPLAQTRNAAEGDTTFRARILANLLPSGATRAAVLAAVQAATGFPVRIMESWSPADTGVLDGLAGHGMMFLDVDNPTTPGRLADWLPYQGFIECTLPVSQPFGPNPTPCLDEYTFNFDVAGSSMIDPPASAVLGQQAVYSAINRAKAFGTIVWVKFVPAPVALSWDQTGMWDQPGLVWG